MQHWAKGKGRVQAPKQKRRTSTKAARNMAKRKRQGKISWGLRHDY